MNDDDQNFWITGCFKILESKANRQGMAISDITVKMGKKLLVWKSYDDCIGLIKNSTQCSGGNFIVQTIPALKLQQLQVLTPSDSTYCFAEQTADLCPSKYQPNKWTLQSSSRREGTYKPVLTLFVSPKICLGCAKWGFYLLLCFYNCKSFTSIFPHDEKRSQAEIYFLLHFTFTFIFNLKLKLI